MHVHGLVRKVTSKTHTRSSSGSSKLTHSWASSGTPPFFFAPIRAEAIGCRTVGVTMPPVGSLVDELRAALAPDRVTVDALELGLYGRDASVLDGTAGVVCFPLTTDELQAAVRIAHAHGRPIVPRGSGTGLAGGAVPAGDVPPVVI